MMINVHTLTKKDIGRKVVYKPNHALNEPSLWETGILSSFRDDGSIFVKFKGPCGERTSAVNLTWECMVERKEND